MDTNKPSSDKPSKDAEYKMPEFVDLSHQEQHFQHEQLHEELPKATDIKVPFYVRILSLFGGAGVFFWMLVNVVITLFFGFLALLLFFQYDHANQLAKMFWNRVGRCAVIALGLLTAFFNPQLGIVVIISYFMLKNEHWEKGVIGSLLHSQFKHYYRF